MADTKISDLTAGTTLAGTEAFPGVQSSATVKITATQIKTWASSSPTLVTPVLGVATGTSVALGGATLGGNALAVTGTVLLNSAVTMGSSTIIVGNLPTSNPNVLGQLYTTAGAILRSTG